MTRSTETLPAMIPRGLTTIAATVPAVFLPIPKATVFKSNCFLS
jgi:hypothetical protein